LLFLTYCGTDFKDLSFRHALVLFSLVEQGRNILMSTLSFVVDHNLCLVSCSADFEQRLGVSCGDLVGSPYSEWVPAIREGGADALRKVVDLGEPLALTGYRFAALEGVWTADVSIDPLTTTDGNDGARVRIDGLKPCRPSCAASAQSGWSDRGKVAAMLSHGVRNPLNAIKGAVTYLQSRYAEEAELQEFAGIMAEEISRLEQFISGFLSTSCQGSRLEPVEVNSLLNKVVAYTALQARAAGVSIALQCSTVPPVRVDAYQFEQAVLNLVNNALTVLGEGGRILLSSAVEHRSGRPLTMVEVADNGPGMDSTRIEALRNPASEPELGKDRGFGLFITREVVTAFGGSLEIDSAEGKGTRVRLILPAMQDEAERQGPP
jgi:two-component system nitrogen regulation sensor histidine kinase GlnL